MKLLGYKVASGVNRTTGKQYTGYRLYFSETDAEGNVTYDDMYIDCKKIAAADLLVGGEFEAYYDRSGRILSLEFTGEVID